MNRYISLIMAVIFLMISSSAFGWTSCARRHQTGNKSARNTYSANRKAVGNYSSAAGSMKRYNEPVHLGPSPLLIRSRIVVPVDYRKLLEEYKKGRHVHHKH